MEAGKKMVTFIEVDKNYKLIRKYVKNKKKMPNELLKLIAPIIFLGYEEK